MRKRVTGAGLTIAATMLACGGSSEDYVVVSRPAEETPARASSGPRLPESTVQQLRACLDQRAGSWNGASYAVQYDGTVDEHGKVLRVKLRDTTLRDIEVETCLRRAISAMTVPPDALHLRNRPVSGGERMMREQRGPLGDSDSQNPLVILAPIIVESVGVEVIIEIAFGIVAAISTVVDPPKDPKKECAEEYAKCLETPTADKRGGSENQSRCFWCNEGCIKNGGNWPFTVTGVRNRPYRCDYWRK